MNVWMGIEIKQNVCLQLKSTLGQRRGKHVLYVRWLSFKRPLIYLLSLLDQTYDGNFLGRYNFLWDRMRAIRMDLRMQHSFNVEAITMLEQMITLHVISMHELCEYKKGEGFSEGFDAHLNIEHINKTSVELFKMYDDHRKKGVIVQSVKEFREYYALLKLDKHPGYKVEPSELSLDLAKMTPDIRQNPEVLFARNVASHKDFPGVVVKSRAFASRQTWPGSRTMIEQESKKSESSRKMIDHSKESESKESELELESLISDVGTEGKRRCMEYLKARYPNENVIKSEENLPYDALIGDPKDPNSKFFEFKSTINAQFDFSVVFVMMNCLKDKEGPGEDCYFHFPNPAHLDVAVGFVPDDEMIKWKYEEGSKSNVTYRFGFIYGGCEFDFDCSVGSFPSGERQTAFPSSNFAGDFY
ncbi:unnamed protein product [Linum tenue]|uniref:SAC3/GANP/THP3 conserved domain-containing protein n=1 Tax=Linum tenue TaxID=586396 RepID=A0AAV0S1I2_9ROSI|nr:unnamed protein product [Linum tenue]